jgi:hypothetical protein
MPYLLSRTQTSKPPRRPPARRYGKKARYGTERSPPAGSLARPNRQAADAQPAAAASADAGGTSTADIRAITSGLTR